VFLGTTVALSMLLIRLTAPKFTVAHREKVERVFALVFLLVVPLSLVVNYLPAAAELKVGFTLPLVFILLAGNKLFDDLQRLSLLKPGLDHKVQHFQNYAISKREKEVALLLLEGKTYRQISDCLHISMPTVKTHASRIYRKCGVNNRSELTVLLIS
ncbi:MAG: helix-turn-helix transcriptional regulator, partial [Bacteroidota bacterium]